MSIYCNMTECAFREELEEPHKRDSLIPVTYTGKCSLSGIVQKNREFLSAGRYKRVEAICNSFLPEGGGKVTKDTIACNAKIYTDTIMVMSLYVLPSNRLFP